MSHACRLPDAAPGELLRAARRCGFTLIELLVVLLVMGLLAGAVTIAAQPDERSLLRVEAERLAQLLDLAAKESRLTGHAMAWAADGEAYRFWRFSEGQGWARIADDALYRPRTLPQGMGINIMNNENLPPTHPMRIEFQAFGGAVPFRIEMSLGAARCALVGSALGEISILPGGSGVT
jgi:general secretion pathway protein H